MADQHRVAVISPAQVPGLLRVLRLLVTEGDIQADEAEAALMAALEAASPDEPGARTARRIELMENETTQNQVKAGIEALGNFSQGRLARAREALLAVPDEQWQAAGGLLGG